MIASFVCFRQSRLIHPHPKRADRTRSHHRAQLKTSSRDGVLGRMVRAEAPQCVLCCFILRCSQRPVSSKPDLLHRTSIDGQNNSIDVRRLIRCKKECSICDVPWFTLFAGRGHPVPRLPHLIKIATI